MTYNEAVPRRAGNLSVNEDVLTHSKALTSNLSRTVEGLLAGFVEAEYARERAEDTAFGQVINEVTKSSPSDYALAPYLHLPGMTVLANPLGIASISRARLGEILAGLADSEQDRIIRAIDETIGRA